MDCLQRGASVRGSRIQSSVQCEEVLCRVIIEREKDGGQDTGKTETPNVIRENLRDALWFIVLSIKATM